MLDFQGLFPFRNRGLFMATWLTHFHIGESKLRLKQEQVARLQVCFNENHEFPATKTPQNKQSQPPTSGGHQTHRLAATMPRLSRRVRNS